MVEMVPSKNALTWVGICEANGFEKGFQTWVLSNLGTFVPSCLPDADFIGALYGIFQEFVLAEVRSERSERSSVRGRQLLEDVGWGGRLIYKSVRDAAPLRLSYIGITKMQPIPAQRWKKEGDSRLLFSPSCVLEEGMPARFHRQTAMLEKLMGIVCNCPSQLFAKVAIN